MLTLLTALLCKSSGDLTALEAGGDAESRRTVIEDRMFLIVSAQGYLRYPGEPQQMSIYSSSVWLCVCCGIHGFVSITE